LSASQPQGGPRRGTERQKKVQLVSLKKKKERKTESENCSPEEVPWWPGKGLQGAWQGVPQGTWKGSQKGPQEARKRAPKGASGGPGKWPQKEPTGAQEG
jgi:hypothetical protein